MLQLRARVDMAMKGCSTFPKSPALLKPHPIRLFSVIYRTLDGGVLLLCREAVSVFYSPSQLGKVRIRVIYIYTHTRIYIYIYIYIYNGGVPGAGIIVKITCVQILDEAVWILHNTWYLGERSASNYSPSRYR